MEVGSCDYEPGSSSADCQIRTRHADHASQDQRWEEKFTRAITCALFCGTPENSAELLLRSSKVILGGAAVAL